jgi:hypothetical protein
MWQGVLMLRTFVAKLSSEDLARFRILNIRERAVVINPRAYDAQQTEDILQDAATVTEGLLTKYGVDDTLQWRISDISGTIWYEND